MKRREFVVTTGVAGTALVAGCVSEDDGESTDEGGDEGEESEENGGDDPEPDKEPTETLDEELDSELASILEAVPASVDGENVQELLLMAPESDPEMGGPMWEILDDFEEDAGVSADDVDWIVNAFVPDFTHMIQVMTGSFEADELEEPDDEMSFYTESGFAVTAIREEDEWEEGIDIVLDTEADPDAGLLTEDLERLLAPVDDNAFLRAQLAPQGENVFGEFDESVEQFVMGERLIRELTTEVAYTVQFEDEDAASEEGAADVMAKDHQAAGERSIEFVEDGQLVYGAFERENPSEYLPDNSPDAQFTIHRGEELGRFGEDPVDPANLEFYVDGESSEPPWGDRSEDIDPDETFELDVEPLQVVEVVWEDPELDEVTQPLGHGVVTGDVFDDDFDPEASELTITYTGDQEQDADRFSVSVYGPEFENQKEFPLADSVGETLEPDEEISLDASVGEQVNIDVDISTDQGTSGSNAYTRSLRPPGQFGIEPSDDGADIQYMGSESGDPSLYEVTVDGTGADRQFDAEYKELTSGDSITVDAEIGDKIGILWTGSDEPTQIQSYTLRPDAYFEFEYDADAETLEITHAGREPVDADELTLEFATRSGMEEKSPWEGEYDQVTDGDTVTVDLDDESEIFNATIRFGDAPLASEPFDHGPESDRETASDSGSEAESETNAVSDLMGVGL